VGARSGLGLALGLQAACNKRLGVRDIDDCHDISRYQISL